MPGRSGRVGRSPPPMPGRSGRFGRLPPPMLGRSGRFGRLPPPRLGRSGKSGRLPPPMLGRFGRSPPAGRLGRDSGIRLGRVVGVRLGRPSLGRPKAGEGVDRSSSREPPPSPPRRLPRLVRCECPTLGASKTAARGRHSKSFVMMHLLYLPTVLRTN